METEWKSIGLYEHPAKHQAGIMSCPDGWAAKIHHDEGDERASAIIIRNVPESVRRRLKAKAAMEDDTMQGVILQLITKYISI